MGTDRRILLHPAQVDFLNCAEPFAAFVGGIGSGKSFVLCYDLLRRVRPGGLYMVIAPTYPMLRDATLRSFSDLARRLGVPFVYNRSENRATLTRTGAEILFRSADNPETLRGPNLSGIALDEASLVGQEVYDISIGRLRQGRSVGFLRAVFTPKGPLHWTCEVFAGGRPNTKLVRCKTKDNPFLPPGFVDAVEEQYGDTPFARQELDGEFVAVEGSEFPAEWFAHEDFWFTRWPESCFLKVVALDPSKGTDGKGEDYQAHVLLGLHQEGKRLVVYVDADLRREGVTDMCRRTVALSRAFAGVGGRPVDSVVVEENGTMGLFPPALEAAVAEAKYPIPWVCRTNSDRKEFRIRYYVGPPLSRGQIRFRNTPGSRLLVGQLQSFPFGEKDDGPDALATALRRAAEMMQGVR